MILGLTAFRSSSGHFRPSEGYVIKCLLSPFRTEILLIKGSYESLHTPKVSVRTIVLFLRYHILNQYSYFTEDSEKFGFPVNLLSPGEKICSGWNFRSIIGSYKPLMSKISCCIDDIELFMTYPSLTRAENNHITNHCRFYLVSSRIDILPSCKNQWNLSLHTRLNI
jgi:hypothetical protein